MQAIYNEVAEVFDDDDDDDDYNDDEYINHDSNYESEDLSDDEPENIKNDE